MPLRLRWRAATHLPVDGSPLKPETFRGATSKDVHRVGLRVGSGLAELGELFEVDAAGDDGAVEIVGDMPGVSAVGRGMAEGTLFVEGNVGSRFAAEMSGGRAELRGRCGDWAGAQMSGGLLRIEGDAGAGLGGAYPGSPLGMREGLILVDGRAGDDVGLMMRRGLIAVRGDVGSGLGRGMVAGTVIACGAVGGSPGLGMKRGSLLLLGLEAETEGAVPPTFSAAGVFTFPYLRLYQTHLEAQGFPLPLAVSATPFDRYNGDLSNGGRGEILAPAPRPAFKVVSPL